MKRTGRPPTKPAKLRDGFYIEVRNRGSKEKGVKIRATNLEGMKDAARQYERMKKEVIMLGEHKDDEWLTPRMKDQ